MRSQITVYRREATYVRPTGVRYDTDRLTLGYLVFDQDDDTVYRYTPDGVMIDRQSPSMWKTGSQRFEAWLHQHHQFWSLDPAKAFYDTDMTVDEGL